MPLTISPDAPADGLEFAKTKLSQFPRELFLGDIESSRWLTVSEPIRVYALPPTEVNKRPDPLSSAIEGPWLYFVLSYPASMYVEPKAGDMKMVKDNVAPKDLEIEGGIELVTRLGDRAWHIGRIAAGRYYRNFSRVLTEAHSLPHSVESRLLDVPGLGCHALWFHGSGGRGDRFSWLPSTEEAVPGPLISHDEFVEKLRKLAPSSSEGIDRTRPRESISAKDASAIDRSQVPSFNPFQKKVLQSESSIKVNLGPTTFPFRDGGAGAIIPGQFGFESFLSPTTAGLGGGVYYVPESKEFVPMTTVPRETQETIRHLEAMPEDDLLAYLGREIEDSSTVLLSKQFSTQAATEAQEILGGGAGGADRPNFLKRLGDSFMKRMHGSFYALICDKNDPDNAKVRAGLELGVDSGSYTLALVLASTMGLGWGIALAAATIVTKRVLAVTHDSFCDALKPDA